MAELELEKLSKEKLKEKLQTTLTDLENKKNKLSAERKSLKESVKSYAQTQGLPKYIIEIINNYQNKLSKIIPDLEKNIEKENAALHTLKEQQINLNGQLVKIEKLKTQRRKELYGEKFSDVLQKREIEKTYNEYLSNCNDYKTKLSSTKTDEITINNTIKLIKDMLEYGEKLDKTTSIILDEKTKANSKLVKSGEMLSLKETLDKGFNELQTNYSELLTSFTTDGTSKYTKTLLSIIYWGTFILGIISTSSLTTIGSEMTKKAIDYYLSD